MQYLVLPIGPNWSQATPRECTLALLYGHINWRHRRQGWGMGPRQVGIAKNKGDSIDERTPATTINEAEGGLGPVAKSEVFLCVDHFEVHVRAK